RAASGRSSWEAVGWSTTSACPGAGATRDWPPEMWAITSRPWWRTRTRRSTRRRCLAAPRPGGEVVWKQFHKCHLASITPRGGWVACGGFFERSPQPRAGGAGWWWGGREPVHPAPTADLPGRLSGRGDRTMSRRYCLITSITMMAVGIAIGGGSTYLYLHNRAGANESTTTSDVVKKFKMKAFLETVAGPTKKKDTLIHFNSVGGAVGSRFDLEGIASWFCDLDQRPFDQKPPVFDRLSQEVETMITMN